MFFEHKLTSVGIMEYRSGIFDHCRSGNRQKRMLVFGDTLFFANFASVMTWKQRFWAFFATGFGAGYWPWGPGTAGAAVAVVLWTLCGNFMTAQSLQCVTLAAIIVATVIGTVATDKLEPLWGEDPKKVVIDEMIGVWIPLLACTWLSWHALLAFVLFRFFDILKPLGIRSLDRRHGGFWVMADDILAGIYSLVIILVLRWLGI